MILVSITSQTLYANEWRNASQQFVKCFIWDLFEICADVSILLVLSLTLYVVIWFFSVPYSMQKFTQQKGRWSQGKSTDVSFNHHNLIKVYW